MQSYVRIRTGKIPFRVINNPDTIIIVHCYDGDAAQVKFMMPHYEHHKCPIIIMSPEDAPVVKMGPHICRTGGKRAYVGPLSLERQRIHLQIMLEYPGKYFVCHDADSVCLEPQFPSYFYNESY